MNINEIPRITRDQKRINVPLDRGIYIEAKRLGIKIQAVCRQAICEAVAILKEEQKENCFYEPIRNEPETGSDETTNALFDAMVRISQQPDRGKGARDRKPDAERIKNAAQRATQQF